MFRTTISINDNLADDVKKRAKEGRFEMSIPQRVEKDLSTFYAFLEREKKLLKGTFTDNEAKLMLDCLNGTILDPYSAQLLEAGFEDGIDLDGLDKKWEIDKAEFLSKFKSMSIIRKWSIYELSTEFWHDPIIDMNKFVRDNF